MPRTSALACLAVLACREPRIADSVPQSNLLSHLRKDAGDVTDLDSDPNCPRVRPTVGTPCALRSIVTDVATIPVENSPLCAYATQSCEDCAKLRERCLAVELCDCTRPDAGTPIWECGGLRCMSTESYPVREAPLIY
jgi:hypothetical protein